MKVIRRDDGSEGIVRIIGEWRRKIGKMKMEVEIEMVIG